jgi:hypothetical protein
MRSWIGIAVAAVMVAGGGGAVAACGTAAASAKPAAAASAIPVSLASAASLVSAGSPSPAAKAAGLAGHLVAEMSFPAGTKPASLRTIPAGLRDDGPPGSHWAHAERLLVAPVKPAAVWAALLSHKPFDDSGSMGSAADNGPVGTDAVLPAPEPGVSAAVASVWLEPWHNGTTLIAAYAYATWLPVRAAAEHLNPGSFRAVTVTATSNVPRQRLVTRTFTSGAIIDRIASFLNARPAAPQLAFPCPFPATSYQATFAPKVKGGPKVTVSPSCMTDQIAVNGEDQPLVWDTSGGLATLLGKIVG